MGNPLAGLGVGIAWRPPIDDLATARAFTEVVAENVDPADPPPTLRRPGLAVVPHGVELGLAGAEPPDPARLDRLATLATTLHAPLVSEHVAFVRAGADRAGVHGDVLEAGHLVPAPRTYEALGVLCDNVRRAQDALPVPLAVENIAATLRWPEDELDEPDFLVELVERTGVALLLDVANLYGTCVAHGGDPHAMLRRLPLTEVAYVHIAGGTLRDGLYADTHADPMHDAVLALLTDVVRLTGTNHPPVLLERDENIRPDVVAAEVARIEEAVRAA